MKTIELHVEQFTFPNCGCCFDCCVPKLKGVIDTQANLVSQIGTVEYDENVWHDEKQLIKAIKNLGFDVELLDEYNGEN